MDFLELTTHRFSLRNYRPDAVPDHLLAYVLECARMAPSACNKQPWRFVVLKSEEAKTSIRSCYSRPWFSDVPCYILAYRLTDKAWVRPDDGKNHGDIDVAIAVEHLCLAAAEKGLGTCWVCNFNVERAKELFPADDQSELVAIIPIGYPSSEATPIKTRKVMSDLVEVR